MQTQLTHKATILRLFHIAVAIAFNGLAQCNGKISIIAIGPTIGDTIAGEQGVVFYAYAAPQHFAIIIIYAMQHIKNNTRVGTFRESIFMYTYTLGSRKLSTNALISKHHFIIARSCLLGVMIKS